MDIKFLEAVGSLPQPLKSLLSHFPDELQKKVREVNIRAGRPVVVNCSSSLYFLKKEGGFSKNMPINPFIASTKEVFECYCAITQYSPHSCQSSVNAGFLTIKGGHRIGISGSCVYEKENIHKVNDIACINLRIAREIKGSAERLMDRLFSEGINSVLIAGEPGSGKTTLLRDIARCFSYAPYRLKTSLIDERGELAAVYRGEPQNEVGFLTDIFDGYKKGDAVIRAVRSMSPQVIIMDEISDKEDAQSVADGMNSGAAIIATVHAQSIEELYRKKHICEMLSLGGFKSIVILEGAQNPCAVKSILSAKELLLC